MDDPKDKSSRARPSSAMAKAGKKGKARSPWQVMMNQIFRKKEQPTKKDDEQ